MVGRGSGGGGRDRDWHTPVLSMCYLMNKLQIELRDKSAGVAPGGRSGTVRGGPPEAL